MHKEYSKLKKKVKKNFAKTKFFIKIFLQNSDEKVTVNYYASFIIYYPGLHRLTLKMIIKKKKTL